MYLIFPTFSHRLCYNFLCYTFLLSYFKNIFNYIHYNFFNHKNQENNCYQIQKPSIISTNLYRFSIISTFSFGIPYFTAP
jgi:hypothetical protein